MAVPSNITTAWQLRRWVDAHYAPALRDSVMDRLAGTLGIGPERRAPLPIGKVIPGVTPPAPTPAPAPAAAPAAAPAPAVSLAREATIQGYDDRIAAAPDRYNAQRTALYAGGARNVTDQGYADSATAEVATTAEDGSIAYRLVIGPDGQLYRQRRNDIDANANARGTLQGSAAREQRQQSALNLNNARDRIVRDLANNQDSITSNQTSEVAGLRADRATAAGEYGDWRAEQARAAADIPAPTPATALPHSQQYAFNPNRQTLDQRFGAGKYTVDPVGNKWIVRWG